MNRAEDIEEHAALWLAREDAGIGPLEQAARDAWLAEATAHRIAYLRLKEAWRQSDLIVALDLSGPRRNRFAGLGAIRLLAAAVILICAGVGGFMFYANWNDTYSTAVGQQRKVRLADGSEVQLNTNTSIRTEVHNNVRSVTLNRGEAYFEVVHDAKRPFVVLAGNRRITDLGTKFSVQRNGDDVEVIVKEGKVRIDVMDAALDRPPVFADGGKVVVAKADETLVATKAPQEIADALDWRFGALVFNQETLGQVAAEFNRYNQKKIIVEGSARDIRIGGSFRADNIQVFAQLLREGFGLTVDQDDSRIVISK